MAVPLALGLAACAGNYEDSGGTRVVYDAAVRMPDEIPDAGSADATTMQPPPAPRGSCGDGVVQPGEVCDDGNREGDDGCASNCRSRDEGFDCRVPGEPCVPTEACGDGRLGGDELCDDGNRRDGDGCSAECVVEPGAVCPRPGARCGAERCGDGIIAAGEECDDGGDPEDGDGCSADCRREPGYACEVAGEPCHLTVCNDGVVEGDEPCDDGNQIVGDGCTPFCELEPDCSAGACRSRCGDGLILPADDEECDDRNTVAGDGCSPDCKVEEGNTCTLQEGELPDVLAVPVTYRDFIANQAGTGLRHPDFEAFSGSDVTPGLVELDLGSDGKPVYTGICDMAMQTACPFGRQMTTKDYFDHWYRDVTDINVTKVERMLLNRDPASDAYRIENSAFFPWDGDPNSWVALGKEAAVNGHDYGFTSEVRYFFEFKLDPAAPQTLTFSGDDDVWVFINHKLAVDIGGLHAIQTRSVTLDEAKAEELGLEPGQIYEIVLFHAERHTTQSNFNLTLDGFVSRTSVCTPDCGDGVVAGNEECDDGDNSGGYGGCTGECKLGPRCGDGVVQKNEGETCDDGNLSDGDGCSAQCESKGPG